METNIKDTAVRSLYAHPQPAGLCAVREYLLTRAEDTRVLLLRWIKEGDFTIDTMTFEVTMLDAIGVELGRKTVTWLDGDIPAAEVGHIFTPERGIPVDGSCMDIRIRLLEVTSGAYVYRVENNTVTVDYIPEEPWKYDAHGGEKQGLNEEHPLRVRSKRAGKVRHLWPIALLAVLFLAYTVVRPYLGI
jgi:hypothetical protein